MYIFADFALDNNLMLTMVQIVAYIAPFFLIPAAFKAGMGAFNTLTGMLSDRSRGFFDGQKKRRQATRASNRQRAGNYDLFGNRNRLARGLSNAYGAAYNPRNTAGAVRGGARSLAREGNLSGFSSSFAASKRTGLELQGEANLENDKAWNRYKNNDKYLRALVDRSHAQEQYSAAVAAGDTNGAAAWRTALDAAGQTRDHNSNATRAAAFSALNKTGYQWSQGQQGYDEVRAAAESIYGTNAGVVGDVMNGAQFDLKNAGRFDLGGINDGAGFNAEAGLNKADPYSLATRGKPEAIREKGVQMRESIKKAQRAAMSGDDATYHAEMEKAKIHMNELRAGFGAATGGNRDAFVAEIESLDGHAMGTDLEAWSNLAYDTKEVREQLPGERPGYTRAQIQAEYTTLGWSQQEINQGWRNTTYTQTRGEAARAKSRGADRPNPAELE